MWPLSGPIRHHRPRGVDQGPGGGARGGGGAVGRHGPVGGCEPHDGLGFEWCEVHPPPPPPRGGEARPRWFVRALSRGPRLNDRARQKDKGRCNLTQPGSGGEGTRWHGKGTVGRLGPPGYFTTPSKGISCPRILPVSTLKFVPESVVARSTPPHPPKDVCGGQYGECFICYQLGQYNEAGPPPGGGKKKGGSNFNGLWEREVKIFQFRFCVLIKSELQIRVKKTLADGSSKIETG